MSSTRTRTPIESPRPMLGPHVDDLGNTIVAAQTQAQILRRLEVLETQEQEAASESWIKRYGIIITAAGGVAASIFAWWVGNERAMVRAQVEHEFEAKQWQERQGALLSRVEHVETATEGGLDVLLERSHVLELRIQRIEAIVETLARREKIELPPPVTPERQQP